MHPSPLPILIRPYTSTDWLDICQIHDSARPLELGPTIPATAMVPMTQALRILR